MDEHARSRPLIDALLVVAVCVTGPLALVLVPHRISLLLGSAWVAAGGPPDARRGALGPGMVVMGGVLALWVTAALGLAIADDPGAWSLPIVISLLSPIAAGLVVAPFVLTPVVMLARREGVLVSSVRSFELAARRGAAPTLALGALLGAIGGAPCVLVPLAFARGGAVAAVVVLLGWAVLAGFAGASMLARAYVDAAARLALDGSPDARVLGGVRRVLVLAAPAVLALTAALLAALLTPSPMRPSEHRGLYPERLEIGSGTALPGPHGIVVTATERGVLVRTADGGGAGEIVLPFRASYELDFGIARATYRGVGAWALLHGDPEDHAAYIDDEGVRLDDELGDRLAWRFGAQSVALLLVAAMVLGGCAWRLGGAAAEARALDAPPAADGLRAALVRRVGRLRLGEGASVEARGDTAVVSGSAHWVSLDGTVVVALPERVRLLVPSDTAPSDGAELAILARADALAALGPRAGASGWPPDARLVLGDRDEAAEILLARASRVASLASLAAAVALGAVALSVVSRL